MRESLAVHVKSPEATRDLGAALGHALIAAPADQAIVVGLSGELGAGKTTLVSGLLQSLGFRGTVKSPTYALLETYELAGRLFHHLDLYRLTDAAELEHLGFHDLLQREAIVLVEWPERATAVLRAPDLAVRIEYSTEPEIERHIVLSAGSETGQKLMDSMASSGFDR